MKIAVLGAGAMGALFGGYLSQRNDVWLIEVNGERARRIAENGVRVREQDGAVRRFAPRAVCACAGLPTMDLVIVFVKAMYTVGALEGNRALIGPDTYLMTLQNGMGHEAKLLRFADADHIILGSTQHNSSIVEDGFVSHGGGGKTVIGLAAGDSARVAGIADEFTACGFPCTAQDGIRQQLWNKLFLNTSASALTALLQVPLGFVLDDPYACKVMETLIEEAVLVANAQQQGAFEAAQVIADVKGVLARSRGGYTSIYADVKAGARSEVDTISGSVVEAAAEAGVSVPCHSMLVSLIHAMEHRMQREP